MFDSKLTDKDLIELFKIFEREAYSRKDLAQQFNTSIEEIDEALNNFELYRKRG